MHALILDNRDNLEPIYYFIEQMGLPYINASSISLPYIDVIFVPKMDVLAYENARFVPIMDTFHNMRLQGLFPY